MDNITPKLLFEFYMQLPDEKKIEFIKLLGSISTPDVVLLLANELSEAEKLEFSSEYTRHFLDGLMPIALAKSWELIQENPDIEKEPFLIEANEFIKDWVKKITFGISEIEKDQIKKSRDRKSDPKTIIRNVEILNLRASDKKKWSLVRLGNKYSVSKRAIQKIITEEAKWRSLAKGVDQVVGPPQVNE